MTEAPRVGVVLSVDPDRFTEAVRAAREAGLAVTAEQPMIGTVSGTVAEGRIPELQAVDGVQAVERERVVRLPPPDAPTQ